MMILFTFVIALLFLWWIKWRWQQTSIFIQLGVPGPQPSLIFGNYLELYAKGRLQCVDEWRSKYGRVFGYYFGMKPVLVVADPHLLKNIFVKDFSKFVNRDFFRPLMEFCGTPKEKENLFNSKGEKWKELRSIITPTFTIAKLKQMSASVNSSIEVMVADLKNRAQQGQEFDINDVYRKLTMNIICKNTIGAVPHSQENNDCKMLKSSKKISETSPFRDPFIVVGMCFPLLGKICQHMQEKMRVLGDRGMIPEILSGLCEVIEDRRKQAQPSKRDLLQLMIEAKIPDTEEEGDLRRLEAGSIQMESGVCIDANVSKIMKTLSNTEIENNCLAAIVAGSVASGNILTCATYLLARHEDIQEQAFCEIDDLVCSGQRIEYATINQLPYIDQVLNETMRIYIIDFLASRYASEDVQYENLKIPKGMLVQAAVYCVHHDPEIWDDPEVFDPNRFSSKPNEAGINFLPFGVGPRNCVGFRFAQMEMRLALAQLLYCFRIRLADSQKVGFELLEKVRSICPDYKVMVKLEMRDHGTAEKKF